MSRGFFQIFARFPPFVGLPKEFAAANFRIRAMCEWGSAPHLRGGGIFCHALKRISHAGVVETPLFFWYSEKEISVFIAMALQ